MARKRIIFLIITLSALISIFLLETLGLKSGLLILVFMIPFNIISLIFYRESKLITTYHVMQIISLSGYLLMYQFPGEYFRFFGLISFLGIIITIILAFGTILQNKTFKFNERGFIYFSIFTLLFYSMYTPYLLNLLKNFFGPDPIALKSTESVYYFLGTYLIVINMIIQLVIVNNNEISIYINSIKDPYKNSYNLDDLPFFKDYKKKSEERDE